MKTYKDKIYDYLLLEPNLSAEELSQKGDIGDRTYVSKLLASLLEEGKIAQSRSGRNVTYSVIDKKIALEENLKLKGLHEDEIWKTVQKTTDFLDSLSENATNILYFGFTEMLNNAIDHSHSVSGYVKIWQESDSLKFIVKDNGIGIFRNVMSKRRLPSEADAARELIKGKLTTAPRWHSGEGIFWTSKSADKFVLKSYNLELSLNNTLDDYSIRELKDEEQLFGTEVYFEISKSTKKSLQKLFRDFSFDHKTLSLDTTVIPIKLFNEGEIWISRSQAKKVLAGLEKYKKVIFDFAGIDVIGQAFADEIFRVFNISHPEIKLEPINMSSSVNLMVSHALSDQTGRTSAN
ncbi:DUF4325 domain-containing protein [Candidatus Saccharibacteria bacterium]|nr:DUF4325 domain-containing protein [Candidatus Saccharibacteria bacterium]